MNSKQATIRALELLGYATSHHRTSRKYISLVHPTAGEFIIGRSGGLRKIPTGGTISSSVSFTDTKTHRQLIQLGQLSENSRLEGTELMEWARSLWRETMRGQVIVV